MAKNSRISRNMYKCAECGCTRLKSEEFYYHIYPGIENLSSGAYPFKRLVCQNCESDDIVARYVSREKERTKRLRRMIRELRKGGK